MIINEDLVGFFNAIPQDRIISSVANLLQECDDLHRRKGEQSASCISVNLGLPSNEDRAFQGKVRTLHNFNIKCIRFEDILKIVQLSFDSGIFTAGASCYRQLRGSPIGNQISPILSSIAIAGNEIAWLQSFKLFLSANSTNIFLTRYVDNRFCIIPESLRIGLAFQAFSKLDFYDDPVLLENVPDDTDLLGFHLDISQRSTTYIVRSNPWDYRTPHSAGSTRLTLGGLRARACIIRNQTWSTSKIIPTLQLLRRKYHSLGFTRQDVSKNATLFDW